MNREYANPVLLVFDIDGTLVDSIGIHESAFLEALEKHGFSASDIDETALLHYTDTWIYKSLFLTRHGRIPDKIEQKQFESDFTDCFKKEFAAVGCREIECSGRFISSVSRKFEVDFCFATGSYRDAACIKLASLAIDYEADILATASEFETREDIVRDCIERASFSKKNAFRKIVLLGDGLWDQRTARKLELDFVGINVAITDKPCFDRGTVFFDDYSNQDDILNYLLL